LRESRSYLLKLGYQYGAWGYWPLLGGLGSHCKKKEQVVKGRSGAKWDNYDALSV